MQQWINKCLSVLVPTLRIWHSESRWAMQIDILSSHNMTQIHVLMIILYCTSIIYIVLCIYNSFICISPQKGFTLLSLISSSILLIQCCQIVIVCILCQINKKYSECCRKNLIYAILVVVFRQIEIVLKDSTAFVYVTKSV